MAFPCAENILNGLLNGPGGAGMCLTRTAVSVKARGRPTRRRCFQAERHRRAPWRRSYARSCDGPGRLARSRTSQLRRSKGRRSSLVLAGAIRSAFMARILTAGAYTVLEPRRRTGPVSHGVDSGLSRTMMSARAPMCLPFRVRRRSSAARRT